VLQDAYPWNVVFEGPRPIFVDFTSIVPQDPNLLWVAYDQFGRFFLYPLVVSSCGLGKVSRAFLLDHINGISDGDLVRLLPTGALLAMPWLLGRVYLPRLILALVRRVSSEAALSRMSARLNPGLEARRAFFKSLRRHVQAIPLRIRKSRWSRYYADIETFLHPQEFNPKQATVARLLDECRPKTVVDIGCNRGGYSILAAHAGARVTAFDTDEDSVALLYELVREKHLDILPLVMDFLSPSPSCGWRAIQYPAAPQRLRSEMALALALVHHLAITQRQTFERIVPALADYAEKWLLTEFVPLDDPRSRELMATQRRDMSWFTLEGFVKALEREFNRVEEFASFPEGRVLLLCTR
jgi:SAM-dependent methyltransferase